MRYGEIVAKKEKRIQQLIDEARGDDGKKDQDEDADEAQGAEGADASANVGRADVLGANTGSGTAGEEGEQARKRRRMSVRYHTLVSHVFLSMVFYLVPFRSFLFFKYTFLTNKSNRFVPRNAPTNPGRTATFPRRTEVEKARHAIWKAPLSPFRRYG